MSKVTFRQEKAGISLLYKNYNYFMKKEKREGFGLLPVSLPDETLRILRWGKARRGVNMSQPLILEAERQAEEIVKKYGYPPENFTGRD